MSNTILKGFYSNAFQRQGGEDSLLLKNFLAGDSGKQERGEPLSTMHSASLFPAHISAAIDTNEWLAEKNKAAVSAAAAISATAAISGKDNIMAPVLKSTSAEYWLDRENRPPVNERVPDPAISLWLAAPRSTTTEGSRATVTAGESGPKRPRIEWPKNITDYRPDDWLAGNAAKGGSVASTSPNREWLAEMRPASAAKSAITTALESLSLEGRWAVSEKPQGQWLALAGRGDGEAERGRPEVGEVDTWLAKNVANFSLGEDTGFPVIGDGESSIEVLEDGDYDLIDGEDDDVEEEEDSLKIDLSMWLVVD